MVFGYSLSQKNEEAILALSKSLEGRIGNPFIKPYCDWDVRHIAEESVRKALEFLREKATEAYQVYQTIENAGEFEKLAPNKKVLIRKEGLKGYLEEKGKNAKIAREIENVRQQLIKETKREDITFEQAYRYLGQNIYEQYHEEERRIIGRRDLTTDEKNARMAEAQLKRNKSLARYGYI